MPKSAIESMSRGIVIAPENPLKSGAALIKSRGTAATSKIPETKSLISSWRPNCNPERLSSYWVRLGVSHRITVPLATVFDSVHFAFLIRVGNGFAENETRELEDRPG